MFSTDQTLAPHHGIAQESGQFSAMATELADQDTVGTALTLQMALGYFTTVISIFVIPLVQVRVYEKERRGGGEDKNILPRVYDAKDLPHTVLVA